MSPAPDKNKLAEMLERLPTTKWELAFQEAFRLMLAEGLSLDAMREQFRIQVVLWALCEKGYNQCHAAQMLKTNRAYISRLVAELKWYCWARLGIKKE